MPSAPPRHVIVPLVVACALFMENMDSTVLATALPAIAVSLDVSPLRLNLAITSYLLSLAVFIPVSGWVADKFGTRTVFRAAIVVFTVGSVLCAFSSSLAGFVGARILQGMGGAMMVPVGRLVLLRSIPKAQLIQAMAYLTVPALIGPIIGPPLGGFITTYASWRWIFFLNVPLGLLGIILVMRYVGNFRDAQKRPFDGKGFALTGSALGFLMYGFDRVGVRDWTGAVLLIVAGIVAGWFAVRHLNRAAHPLVELSAMRVKSFSISVWGGVLFRMTVGATPVLLPLMFQRGFGMTAFASGGLTLAYAAGNLGMKPFTTPILRWFGYRNVMNFNAMLSAGCILLCGLLLPGTPVWLMFVLLVLTGGFRSLGLTCLFTLPYVDVAPHQRTAATTMMSVVQQAGFGLGVAFSTIALQFSLLARGAGPDDLTMSDFRVAFAAVAALGLLVLLHFWRLAPDAGVEVSGHGVKQRAAEVAAD